MNRVLVTGARGFIGRPVVAQLLARGYEVHAVSSQDPAGDSTPVVWHQADLLDPEAAARVAAAVRAPHLLHLAWTTVPGQFWSATENTDWISATLRLLREFAQAGGRRAVVAGSCAEYEWGGDVLSEDSTPLSPATLYGTCKHATRIASERLVDQLGLEFAWGRIFFLYGPGEHPERLVAAVARGLLAGDRVPTTAGVQVRDFMHVDDVAGAFVELLGGGVTGAVNIASGQPVSVRDVVTEIGVATGRLDHVDFGALPLRENDPSRIVADVSRLRDEVGFLPRIELSDGIAQTVDWWRASRDRGSLSLG